MKVSYLYVTILLVSPLLAFTLNGFRIGLSVLLTSVAVVKVTRRKASSLRRMICLCVLINQLAIIHSVYRFKRPIVARNFTDEVFYESADSITRPFVSVVLLNSNKTNQEDWDTTLLSLIANTSHVLAKEIVVGDVRSNHTSKIPIVSSANSTGGELTVYVKSGVQLPADWLNGFVREYLVDGTRVLVPELVTREGSEVSSAMLGSVTGELHLMPLSSQERRVPVILAFSVVGVPSGVNMTNVGSLLLADKLVEVSLRAWFCFGGIYATRFTSVFMDAAPLPNWRSVEGEDVDEKIEKCNGRDIDWFYDEFREFDEEAPLPRFQIQSESACVRLSTNNRLSMVACNSDDVSQLFTGFDFSRLIRSVSNRNLCLDAGNAKEPGSTLIPYKCLRANRNQMFSFQQGRLMWGSCCVAKGLVLEFCDSNAVGTIRQIFI